MPPIEGQEIDQGQAPAAPDTPPEVNAEPGGEPEAPVVQAFNQDARDGIEDAYERFMSAEREVPPAPAAPAPEPPDTPSQQPIPSMDPPAPGFDLNTQGGDPPRLKYPSHEEAERGAAEAARRMHEATQRAAQLERDNEALRNAALKILASVQAQGNPQPTTPVQPDFRPDQPIPGVDYQKIEEQTGFTPEQTNFLFSAFNGLRDNVIQETTQTVLTREQQAKKAADMKAFNVNAETYFRTKHKELVPMRETVMRLAHELVDNPAFVAQINASGAKTPAQRFTLIIDHAAERVRKERLPQLVAHFGGVIPSGPGQVTREPLQSGTPPVMPRSAGTPVVRPAQVERGETPDEYFANRRKQQDRMMSGYRGR